MRLSVAFAGIFACAVARATPVSAQRTPVPAPAVAAPAKSDGGGKKALNVPDYARWRSIGSVAISDDGAFATWSYTQRNVDDTLYLKNLSTDAETKIPRANAPQFSDDSKWVVYNIAPPGANRAGGRGGRGGGDQGGQGGQGEQGRRTELRNLATGAVTSYENVQSTAFNKGSTVLIIRKNRPPTAAPAATEAAAPAGGGGGGGGRGGRGGGGAAAPATVGTDLIIHRLATGTDELVGSVSAADFNRAGSMLAYTVASADRDGNGVFVASLESGTRRVLDNQKADYARLTWDSTGNALAVLRGADKRGFTEKENVLIAFTGLDGAEPVRTEVATAGTDLNDKWVISERGTLRWTPDRTRIFVDLKAQEARPAPARRDSNAVEDPVANVDVWHWKDEVIQPVQMLRVQQDRNRTYPASVILASRKIVPLADERMQTVQITRDGAWGIGRDEKEYIDDWKPRYADYYRVNTATGERTLVFKKQLRTLGLSPDSKYFLYWQDANVWAYDITKNTHTNLTKSAPVSFVNLEEDHVGEKPAYGVTGYSKDGKYVILDHKYDIWRISLDGSEPPKNLTNGLGTKNSIRFRYERIEPNDDPTAPPGGGGGGRGGGGAAATIDLSKPVSLGAFGDTDKKDGFYELRGDSLVKLVFDDHGYGRVIKARNADRALITRESWVDFPDYYLTDGKLSTFKKLTNANPQQAEYLWGHRILFDYKDKDGHKLQGTLAIPDSYQPGQKLPMLVDYYEKYSQNLNRYSVPRYATAPQFADYVSNGYLVMQPDVYYHTGASHTDMLNSVEAAVKRVIELGYVDPKRVGLHGHS
ncbi:MAG TPA: hypothetical protein VE967_07345, partial [Gemmatimonadaceae bacterium]|nr:hypothetical protein [Gemmatimonadaceae bacterium]